jgi:hypothetical protein
MSSLLSVLSRHPRSGALLLALILIGIGLGTPSRHPIVRLHTAVSTAVRLLHEADGARREIHPLPLLG